MLDGRKKWRESYEQKSCRRERERKRKAGEKDSSVHEKRRESSRIIIGGRKEWQEGKTRGRRESNTGERKLQN